MDETRSKALVTDALRRWSEGDRSGLGDAMGLVYGELRTLCQNALRRERQGHTLDTTALVHELYLRLTGLEKSSWESRRPFFALCSGIMRRVLVDSARKARAKKRGSGALHIPVHGLDIPTQRNEVLVLTVDALLTQLAEEDPRLARIVELRCFAGLTEMEIAEALDISRRTVQREWRVARLWLARELTADEETE